MLFKFNLYRYTKMPEKPITVYSYEASPFCKLVREKLVELEIPHLLKVGTVPLLVSHHALRFLLSV